MAPLLRVLQGYHPRLLTCRGQSDLSDVSGVEEMHARIRGVVRGLLGTHLLGVSQARKIAMEWIYC